MKIIELEQLDEKQIEAVNHCLDMTKRCVAVSGAAGSGKTTIIRFAYEKLVDAGYTVALAAPTGKAAKRIREATGLPAQTVHKLLEFSQPDDIDPKTGKPCGASFPRKTAEDRLSYDVVIVDEYAMVHQELHTQIVAALPQANGRLLAFGDTNQLPPIETLPKYQNDVSAFKMLLDKGENPSVNTLAATTLGTVHRQADGSDILVNASRVLSGLMPQNKETFKLINTPIALEELMRLCGKHDFASIENQIITPANISWIGTTKLNPLLQTFIWANADRKMYSPMRWFNKNTNKGAPAIEVGIGDKVVITANTYNLPCSDGSQGLFNGEVGIIIEISELEEIVIDFGDRVCRVPHVVQGEHNGNVYLSYPHRSIDLAYALTTHKCQGSEFKHVAYMIDRSVFRMLNRKNLYTAITRARESVSIIFNRDALVLAVTKKE